MTKEQFSSIQAYAKGKETLDPGADANGFFDCGTEECAFNNRGRCRYHAVYGGLPCMTEDDGCLSAAFPDAF